MTDRSKFSRQNKVSFRNLYDYRWRKINNNKYFVLFWLDRFVRYIYNVTNIEYIY